MTKAHFIVSSLRRVLRRPGRVLGEATARTGVVGSLGLSGLGFKGGQEG